MQAASTPNPEIPSIGISAPNPFSAPPQAPTQGDQSTDAGAGYPPAYAQSSDWAGTVEQPIPSLSTGQFPPSGPVQSVGTSSLAPPAAPGTALTPAPFEGGMLTGPSTPSAQSNWAVTNLAPSITGQPDSGAEEASSLVSPCPTDCQQYVWGFSGPQCLYRTRYRSGVFY